MLTFYILFYLSKTHLSVSVVAATLGSKIGFIQALKTIILYYQHCFSIFITLYLASYNT